MILKINGEDRVIPSSLSEVILKQRIEFQSIHGDLLDEMKRQCDEIEDELLKEVALTEYQVEYMFRELSYFLNVTVEALKETEFIDTIIRAYSASMAVLHLEELALAENPSNEFHWRGEIWELHPPVLKNGDKMTFGELIDSKQMIQNMIELGKNRWECLVPLSAIFLRKRGEEYQESFLYEGSERLKLMEELPMDIALQVNFFLSSSLSLLTKTFQSSVHQGLSQEVVT